MWFSLLACSASRPVETTTPTPVPAPRTVIPDLPDLAELPVPIHDVQPGQALRLEDLLWIALPPDYVPENSVIAGADQVLGRVSTARLLKHELIRIERLAADPAPQPLPEGSTPRLSDAFHPDPAAPPNTDLVMAIVSARALEAGTVIAEPDLYAVQIPLRYLSSGVFLSPNDVVGRTVCENILPNEFVRAERLFDTNGACTLAAPDPQ